MDKRGHDIRGNISKIAPVITNAALDQADSTQLKAVAFEI